MRVRRLVVALALIALACTLAFARPGGGDSFSGGGGHSSGGGGGGGSGSGVFELVYWIIRICIYYPAVGLPILGAVIAWIIWNAYKQNKNKDWDSGPAVALNRAVSLEPVKKIDPDFSQVLFEDFANRLFSAAQRARASEDAIATVAPYVGPSARSQLLSRTPGVPVLSVVVGALRAIRTEVPPTLVDDTGAASYTKIVVEYEANVSTAQHTYYTVETWTFMRAAGRVSKPPGATKTFPCPNCGAPWAAADTGTQKCASCGEIVDNGRFDWLVAEIDLMSSDERPPTVTKEVEERGTDLDTYRASDVDRQWTALRTDDPAITEDNLVARLTLIYNQLNKSWSNNDLVPARGVVSDGLFDYLQYWVDVFKSQQLRNQLTDMQITETAVAKITRDKYYDAVTIRLWGRGADFVINTETGRLVRGSKSIRRKYSEYWTLIRTRGRKGAPNAEPTCSNCGAPLNITMAGECEHCAAHVTAGEFDWVLSKIEQDDTYRG